MEEMKGGVITLKTVCKYNWIFSIGHFTEVIAYR